VAHTPYPTYPIPYTPYPIPYWYIVLMGSYTPHVKKVLATYIYTYIYIVAHTPYPTYPIPHTPHTPYPTYPIPINMSCSWAHMPHILRRYPRLIDMWHIPHTPHTYLIDMSCSWVHMHHILRKVPTTYWYVAHTPYPYLFDMSYSWVFNAPHIHIGCTDVSRNTLIRGVGCVCR